MHAGLQVLQCLLPCTPGFVLADGISCTWMALLTAPPSMATIQPLPGCAGNLYTLCLLSFCGDQAIIFEEPTVQQVHWRSSNKLPTCVLGLEDSQTVIIRRGKFMSSYVDSVLRVSGNSSLMLEQQSSIHNCSGSGNGTGINASEAAGLLKKPLLR